jgi:protein-disulfide isomerase
VTRERRVWLLAGAAALAAVVVLVAILVSQGGGDDDSGTRAAAPRGLFEGIPQDGVSLGDPDAPATLIEFADLQCPFCRDYAVDTLPGIVDRYVRPGDLRLELRLLAFLGPDSERGRLMAHGTAQQDRLWEFSELFFRNQGEENSGYATNEFLARLAGDTPGLDRQQLLDDMRSPEARALSRQAERLANRLGVQGTPSFYLVKDGGQPQPIEIDRLGEALGGG